MSSHLLEYSSTGFDLPFSRKHEEEADYLGLILMANACYDVHEAARLWGAFEGGDELSALFSTHPSNTRRQELMKHHAKEAAAVKTNASWCAKIENMLKSSNRHRLLRRLSTNSYQHRAELDHITKHIEEIAERKRASPDSSVQ